MTGSSKELDVLQKWSKVDEDKIKINKIRGKIEKKKYRQRKRKKRCVYMKVRKPERKSVGRRKEKKNTWKGKTSEKKEMVQGKGI